MAVLGHRGTLRLQREAPEAVVLPSTAVQPLSNSILVRNPGYWSGDEVTIISSNGLPIAGDTGLPACPDGHAVYVGADWVLGANRTHISDEDDQFYAADDETFFYLRPADVGLLTSSTVFVYRDQLDRLSFYTSQAAALRGAKNQRIPLFEVDFGSLLLAPVGSLAYQSALTLCSQQLEGLGAIEEEVGLTSICASAPDYQAPIEDSTADDSDSSPCSSSASNCLWKVQGQLSEWSLSLNAQEVDTTAVGEKFGDSVKSLITGGGQIDFLVARKSGLLDSGAAVTDSTTLMRLLLMSEKGCKASAQFWMINDQVDAGQLLPGDLYYDTQFLVTSMAINTRAVDIIAGSLNFVTVGEIRLKMGTN